MTELSMFSLLSARQSKKSYWLLKKFPHKIIYVGIFLKEVFNLLHILNFILFNKFVIIIFIIFLHIPYKIHLDNELYNMLF